MGMAIGNIELAIMVVAVLDQVVEREAMQATVPTVLLPEGPPLASVHRIAPTAGHVGLMTGIRFLILT